MLFADKEITFSQLVKDFLKLRAFKSKRTEKNAKWNLGRLNKFFGPFRVVELNDHLWIEYISFEQKKGDRKFFDERKYMRMLLGYALKKKIVKAIPELPIPDPPCTAGREISTEELIALEANATPDLRLQIRIGWKMGLRRGEMFRLRWTDFNWKEGTVRIYATKTRSIRTNPVPADLMAEFKEKMRCSASLCVFPNPNGTGSITSNHTAWERCRRKAGVNVRWQDLRITCASILSRKGNRTLIGATYLGHSEKIHTTRYVRPHLKDLRRAAESMSTVTMKLIALKVKDWLRAP